MKRTLVFSALAFASASLFAQVEIGWGEVDITPPFTKKVPLGGQYYQRLATGVHTPIAITAVAIRNGGEYFLTASFDNVSVREGLIDEIRAGVKARIPEIDVSRLSINCDHSHCAPNVGQEGYLPEGSKGLNDAEDIWSPGAYQRFALPKLVEAYCRAWRNLKPGSIARAKGLAEIGHCRIAMYRDGHGEMYGDTARDDFAGMSDGEDPKVEMLFTYDDKGKWSGAIFNVACPAQVLEATYEVSGDICGVLRQKMKALRGEDFRVIYQPAASGCQSPRDLVRGYRDTLDGWHKDTCEMLAERLVTCAKEAMVMPREDNPVVKAVAVPVTLPRRRVTPEEVAAAEKELKEICAVKSVKEHFNDFLADVRANEKKGGPGPYDSKFHPFVLADIDQAVIARAKEQDVKRDLKVEICAMRVGDVAFVTCPFELYLLYGQVIKARSAAKQTFVVELCNGDYGYVPSPVVIRSRSYGSGVNNGEVGPDGGYKLADESVKAIRRLF